MKVKFNLPISRYNSQLNYDFNSTFTFGSIQASLCKFVVPKSKFNINVSQLVRTAPLVVPTFGRMAIHNIFAYVPMSMIFPAYDAFVSATSIKPDNKSYIPSSLPVVTNNQLACMLMSDRRYSHFESFEVEAGHDRYNARVFEYNNQIITINFDGIHVPDDEKLGINYDDVDNYTFDYVTVTKQPDGYVFQSFYKLTDLGRKIYSLLRSLGYSCDYLDKSPVSVLPILAHCKAVYDILYPKRDTPWHVTDMYTYINRHYNGNFSQYTYNGHVYDLFWPIPIDGNNNSRSTIPLLLKAVEPFIYAPIGRNLSNIATATPIVSASVNTNAITTDVSSNTQAITYSDAYGAFTTQPTALNGQQLSLVQRLWSFVQRNGVVGQDVKNWFKTHFGAVPTEDMFSQSYVIRDVVNQLNVNTVVSTAETKSDNGGDVLGALAGQSYSATSDKVSFEVPNFGYLICLTYVVPVCRISSGTQPELYNISYFDMPFPDFDGLGYETLNTSSFQESDGLLKNDNNITQGFGYVPRMTSFKTINNVRSGGFALPSLRDSYLPYCLDNCVYIRPALKDTSYKINDIKDVGNIVPINSQTLSWYYPYGNALKGSTDISTNNITYTPWRIFDTIFYNTADISDKLHMSWQVENFMLQNSFQIDVSSYLKPLSDSYEITQLGKNVVSTDKA